MNLFIPDYDPNRYDDSHNREYVHVEIGFIDDPVCTLSIRRGATPEECLEELQSMQKAFGDNDLDFYEKKLPEDAWMAYREANFNKFAEVQPQELVVVFLDDLGQLKTPIVCERKKAAFPNDPQWGVFNREIDVITNWSDSPGFADVWNKHRVSWDEAVKRIGLLKPIPKPQPEIFKVDPRYLQDINELLPKVVKIEDKANAPYQFVVDQMELQLHLAHLYANLACKKLMALTGKYKPPCISPMSQSNSKFYLYFELCQYDDWNEWYDFLSRHCKIGPWEDRRPEKFPVASFDVSNDPDFKCSEQTSFEVRLGFYDSHFSGF